MGSGSGEVVSVGRRGFVEEFGLVHFTNVFDQKLTVSGPAGEPQCF